MRSGSPTPSMREFFLGSHCCWHQLRVQVRRSSASTPTWRTGRAAQRGGKSKSPARFSVDELKAAYLPGLQRTEDVQRLKSHLSNRAPKTVNNVLVVLNVLLKQALDWTVITEMPCTIRLLATSRPQMGFYHFDEYERLVSAAKAMDSSVYLIVLLGGEAGLRCGEIIALEWGDVDLGKRQLCIQRSEWRGHVTVPKGWRLP